jgi:hypothetical protein
MRLKRLAPPYLPHLAVNFHPPQRQQLDAFISIDEDVVLFTAAN